MRLLFVTWDGPDTTYHESLFLPVLDRVRQPGDEVALLQFTWGAPERTARLRRLTARAGIAYDTVGIPHHGRMLATPPLMPLGAARLRRIVRDRAIDVVVARSVPPAAMAIVAQITGSPARFVYDADGLIADQRVDHSGWPSNGVRARAFRLIELTAVRRADRVLTRTHRAASILAERAQRPIGHFSIVVNGKDATVFHPGSAGERSATRGRLGIGDGQPVLVYVGSIGSQYEPRAMVDTFRSVHQRDGRAHLLLLTPRINHPMLRALLADLPPGTVTLRDCAPPEVPGLLAAADLGLAYRMPTTSQQAVAPIKIAEYLLCGVPVAYTRGVGDLDDQLAPSVAVGVTADDGRHARVTAWLLDEVLPARSAMRDRCRRVGLDRYSLEVAARSYRQALAGLGQPARTR